MSVAIEAHRQNIAFLSSRFQAEQDLLAVVYEMIGLTGSLQTLDDLIAGGK